MFGFLLIRVKLHCRIAAFNWTNARSTPFPVTGRSSHSTSASELLVDDLMIDQLSSPDWSDNNTISSISTGSRISKMLSALWSWLSFVVTDSANLFADSVKSVKQKICSEISFCSSLIWLYLGWSPVWQTGVWRTRKPLSTVRFSILLPWSSECRSGRAVSAFFLTD